MPGMMHLKDVHRYKHHLELLNQGKRNTQVLQVNMLLDIVQRMEHEDQSHEEALEALNILFNKIDPDRNLRGHDGRVAQPTLYKSLAYDPQARSLLSLVSKRASLQRDTAESETRRQMAKRVDSLLALLIQESDGKNDARPMLSISIVMVLAILALLRMSRWGKRSISMAHTRTHTTPSTSMSTQIVVATVVTLAPAQMDKTITRHTQPRADPCTGGQPTSA